jgi:hypothetical protein
MKSRKVFYRYFEARGGDLEEDDIDKFLREECMLTSEDPQGRRYLWHERPTPAFFGSTVHIIASYCSDEGWGRTRRNVEIESMPPAQPPRELSDYLNGHGFKESFRR